MADPIDGSFEQKIAFGPFVLIPAQQLLLKADLPVQVGARAFDILTCLVERAGEVVSKEELIAHVWPNVFVQEGNLKVHVATLRQALGDGQGGNRFIVTFLVEGIASLLRFRAKHRLTGRRAQCLQYAALIIWRCP